MSRAISRSGEQQVEQQVLDYFKQTPLAIGVLVMSFFSGQLWAFVLTAFRSKTRGNKLIESFWGRVAIGVTWFTAVCVPLYYLRFRDIDFQYDRILQIAIPTIVSGMLLQLILFALFMGFGSRK